ncbi:MAG: molybdopterin-dependent oxidoreductase [Pseudomonadales bacterium]|nr:molybdopterin-dependent oxidoreductase [Pseudomonadales bacterium]
MEPKTTLTNCKVGACEPQCGIKTTVRDNRIIAVEPDPDHPISQGYICKKGMAIPEYVHDPDRLRTPEKRSGFNFEPISWASASQEIGATLKQIHQQYGSNAIATYWGNAADTSGILMADTLCSAFGSPNSFNVLSLEYTDRGMVAEHMFGNEYLILQPDAAHADFALLLGTNPLVTQGMTLLQRHPRIAMSLKAIQQRGGKVIVVDPRQTETTKIADLHVPIVPGTDVFFLAGLVKYLIEGQHYDAAYSQAYTRDIVPLTHLLNDISWETISEKTGVPSDQIQNIADQYARSNAGFVTTRVGVQTSCHSTLTEWMVQVLNSLTGNIGRKGGLYYQPGAIDNQALIQTFSKHKNKAPSRIGQYPQIFGGPPASTLADHVLSNDNDRIRALIVIAGNPAISFPNHNKLIQALKKLDLLVCIDLYRSDTGAFAHYNLPATTIYEKGGLHFLTQPFDPYPYIEWRQQILNPFADARPEWDIVRDICRQAKIPFLNNPTVSWLDRLLSIVGKGFSEKMLAQALLLSPWSMKKLSLRALMHSPYGLRVGELTYADTLTRYIKTDDGKIQLAPERFLREFKNILSVKPSVSARYPFKLISGCRSLSAFNSWTHNMKSLSASQSRHSAFMNPQDADRLGLSQGDNVTVVTETGELTLPITPSARINSGTVMIPQFWGHHFNSSQSIAKANPGVNVNVLHSDKEVDTFTGMPIFNGTPCDIRVKKTKNAS